MHFKQQSHSLITQYTKKTTATKSSFSHKNREHAVQGANSRLPKSELLSPQRSELRPSKGDLGQLKSAAVPVENMYFSVPLHFSKVALQF